MGAGEKGVENLRLWLTAVLIEKFGPEISS